MNHYHAATRTNSTDGQALAFVYPTASAAHQDAFLAAAAWINEAPDNRRVTEGTGFAEHLYFVAAYDSYTGEDRSWSAWPCQCADDETELIEAGGDGGTGIDPMYAHDGDRRQ